MEQNDIDAWVRVATSHMPPRFIEPDARHRVIMSEDFSQEDRRATILDMVNMLGEKGCTWFRMDESEDGRVMLLAGWKNRPRLPDLEARPNPDELKVDVVPA